MSLALIGAALAGCSDKQDRARQDAQDVAAVKRLQNQLPPIEPIAPEPMHATDLAQIDAPEGVCAFVPGTASKPDALLLVDTHFAWIKLDNGIVRLTSDTGSSPGPLQSWTHYVGKDFTLRIEAKSSTGSPALDGDGRWLARLSVRDPDDRVVFSSDGELSCAKSKRRAP